MLDRRSLVYGGLSFGVGAGLCCATHSDAFSQTDGLGCAVYGASAATCRLSREKQQAMRSSTGNRELDEHLGNVAIACNDFFGIAPKHQFYPEIDPSDHCTSVNATATKIGRSGVVTWGAGLIRNYGRNWRDPIVMITGHEYGHIYDFYLLPRKDLVKLVQPRRLFELHADYMAGLFFAHYIIHYEQVRRSRLDRLVTDVARLGSQGANPTHGRSEERVACFKLGVTDGLDEKPIRVMARKGVIEVVKRYG